ncbi:hypothetical protein PYW08_007477 [Mythimna loreyi]|uniref:Uncharacterized protein n=1 Tax=Mythimna loreyi TaxID=667449 RepID=A0ACC2QBV6_9NEOP|nr:hypothetical protein PYW08_007477 [Mythimna loreyi]
MIRLLVVLGLVASVTPLFGTKPKPWKQDISYKFDVFDGFHFLPRNITLAEKEDYIQIENPHTTTGFGKLTHWIKRGQWCYLVSLFYDENEQIAGIQINQPVQYVNSHFDLTAQGFKIWNHLDVDYAYYSLFWVSEDEQTRVKSYDPEKVIRDEYLTVSGYNGDLDKIPTDSRKLESIWKEQACIPMMGRHYYYNMTQSQTCDTPFYPWFPLSDVRTNQIIGLGAMYIGESGCKMEAPSTSAVKMIVPTGPQCLYDLVDKYHASTLHVYFVDLLSHAARQKCEAYKYECLLRTDVLLLPFDTASPTVMFRTLIFFGLVACATPIFGASDAKPWNENMAYKFDILNGFHFLPLTLVAAKNQGYELVQGPKHPGYSQLNGMWVKKDQECLLIGLYYDVSGRIAAVQINQEANKVNGYYDATRQGFKTWTYNSVNYLYITIYLVGEDGQNNSASYDSTKVLRDEYLRVTGLNGTLDKIATNPTKIDSVWTEQACIIMMGKHYYYKMTPTLSCDSAFYPWFPLYDMKTNQMIGVGFMALGQSKCNLEKPDVSAVKMIVPTAPQCLYDLVEKIGVSTLHIYFVDRPRFISC